MSRVARNPNASLGRWAYSLRGRLVIQTLRGNRGETRAPERIARRPRGACAQRPVDASGLRATRDILYRIASFLRGVLGGMGRVVRKLINPWGLG